MTQEIVPFKSEQQSEQHPVTWVPTLTTELPFFYLTKDRTGLNKRISISTSDKTTGKPIQWKVVPSTLGAPGIEAHEVWVKHVKPSINAARERNGGRLPSIIPLGAVRQCLRILGWSIGGWEARDFLQALQQIAYAGCEADFWHPTREKDTDGQLLYAHVKGSFTRLSIYAIGSKHLTDEDIRSGRANFDFDLEDIVYIQLHPFEVQMQESQPERPIDNEYMFSVSPSARRWYELLQPSFYGVTNNRGPGYCEILYSWYVERHHTLKRHHERYRVVGQMNRLIREHMEFGYVMKVEYFEIMGKTGELPDFRIRYWPGEGARQSSKRIAQHKKPKALDVQLPLPLQLEESTLTKSVHELVTEFHRLVSGMNVSAEYFPGVKELSLAENIINHHGVEKARHIVEYGVGQAKETRFDMQNFCALRQYVTKGARHYDQVQRQQEDASRRHAEQQFQRQRETAAEEESRRRFELLTPDEYQTMYKAAVAELVKQMPERRRDIEHPNQGWKDSIEARMQKKLQ